MGNVRGIRFDNGIETISHRSALDEVHLPGDNAFANTFRCDHSPCMLNQVLRRPSLDQRLADLLLPESIDPNLMEPAVLSKTRIETMEFLSRAMEFMGSDSVGKLKKRALRAAVAFLSESVSLDEELHKSLSALLRA